LHLIQLVTSLAFGCLRKHFLNNWNLTPMTRYSAIPGTTWLKPPST
jgi:hypothetical protein